jgi:hypothetical protein
MVEHAANNKPEKMIPSRKGRVVAHLAGKRASVNQAPKPARLTPATANTAVLGSLIFFVLKGPFD